MEAGEQPKPHEFSLVRIANGYPGHEVPGLVRAAPHRRAQPTARCRSSRAGHPPVSMIEVTAAVTQRRSPPGKIIERRVDRARDTGSDLYGGWHGAGESLGGDVRSAVSAAADRVSGTPRRPPRRSRTRHRAPPRPCRAPHRAPPVRSRTPRQQPPAPCRRRRKRSGGRPGATRWPPGSSPSVPAGRRHCRTGSADVQHRRRCSRQQGPYGFAVGEWGHAPAGGHRGDHL